MKFEEKKAQEIIEKYNLSDATLKVWKHRGEIPDQYANSEYSRLSMMTDTTEYKKACAILALPEIHNTMFTLGKKGSDVSRKKDRMTIEEFETFSAEIAEIKKVVFNVLKTATETTLRAVAQDPRLVGAKIFGSDLYGRIVRSDVDRVLTDAQRKLAQQACASFFKKL